MFPAITGEFLRKCGTRTLNGKVSGIPWEWISKFAQLVYNKFPELANAAFVFTK
jgi:hypothetical protein